MFTLRSTSERSICDMLFTLRSLSERSVGVFYCFPMLNWNSSGGTSLWFLKRFPKLSGILFVILAVDVVKSLWRHIYSFNIQNQSDTSCMMR